MKVSLFIITLSILLFFQGCVNYAENETAKADSILNITLTNANRLFKQRNLVREWAIRDYEYNFEGKDKELLQDLKILCRYYDKSIELFGKIPEDSLNAWRKKARNILQNFKTSTEIDPANQMKIDSILRSIDYITNKQLAELRLHETVALIYDQTKFQHIMCGDGFMIKEATDFIISDTLISTNKPVSIFHFTRIPHNYDLRITSVTDTQNKKVPYNLISQSEEKLVISFPQKGTYKVEGMLRVARKNQNMTEDPFEHTIKVE